MEPMNCTVHLQKDRCDIWVGTQCPTITQSQVAELTGLPKDAIKIHNHLIGGGFGRRLEADGTVLAVKIAKHVDGPVKVIWSREEDIQHDMYRPSANRRPRTAASDWGKTPPGRRRPSSASQSERASARVSSNGPNGSAAGPRRRGGRVSPRIASRIHNPSPFVQTHGSLACRGRPSLTGLLTLSADERGRQKVASDIRDNPTMSRVEMPLGDGALAVAYYKVEDDASSTRRCRKSCPAWDTDHDWRMASSKPCDAMGKE
jgi:hypothetical protein